MNILDIFFPKRCVSCRTFGAYICSNCFSKLSFEVRTICFVCNNASIDGKTHPSCSGRYIINGGVASVAYNETMKRLIYSFKYAPYVSHLQSLLVELMYEGLIQKEIFYILLESQPLLVPIPLHSMKYKQRGYNQALLLARGIEKKTGLEVKDVLMRVKKTGSQYKLSREERKQNISGAFSLSKKITPLVQQRNILLIDDVATTGATLLEASRILKHAGANEVWGVTLAHGQ